jgi:uncharacterized membrane protein YhaH (DUF805 family)
MSPARAVATCLGKYATFRGRASRPEFWWFWLFVFLSNVAAVVVDSALGTPFVVTAIVVLALVVPGLAAAVRRLHDTGRSGWWYLVAFIPFIGGIWLVVMLAQESRPASSHA